METGANPQKPQASEPAAATASAAEPKAGGTEAARNALALQALQQLRAGLSQSLLYAADTKQFEKAAENVFVPLNGLLEAIGNFTLMVSKADALINGSRIEVPAAFRATNEQLEKVMNAASVASLRVEKGLTAPELGKFLQLLARRKLGSTDGAKINQNLRDQGITHIQTGELRWVAIGAQEKVVDINAGGVPGLANAMAQTAAGGAVDSFVRIAQRVEDPVAREQLRAEITEQLLQKDPGMLGNLLLTATQHLKDPGNEPYRAMVALPGRDGELLNAILQLAKPLAEKGLLESSGSAEALRALIARVAAPYQSRAEDIMMTVQFEPAVAALLPDWLLQAYASLRGGSAAERLAGILTQSPNALLDEQMFAQIVDVLDELSVAGMGAEAERLMVHVSGALRAVTKAARATAVQRLSFLLARSMEQASPAVKILENALLEACTHETCDEVMQLLLAHLSKRCVHHYQLGNFDRALEHLRWITSLEESSRVALKDEGANLARGAREELAKSDFGKRLAQDLFGGDQKAQIALQMAQTLGKDVWMPLVARLGTETDPQAAGALAACVPAFGKEAVQQFFTMLEREQNGPATLRLLALAPALGDAAQVSSLLPALLRHNDKQVRNHVLGLIRQGGDEGAVKVVVEVLHQETDAERRSVLVTTLSQLQHSSALAALLAELETARNAAPLDEEYTLTLLEALNTTGKQEIIPGVMRFVMPRGRTMILTADGPPPIPKAVTMATIKTLARFFKNPTVAETLERLRKEKDPDISRLALVSLRGIVAAEAKPVPPPMPPPPPAAPAAPAAAAPAAAPAPPRRKPHRAFEALEEQIRVETVLRGGTGASTPVAATNVAAPPAAAAAEAKPWAKGGKPVAEGLLQDLGLVNTLMMLGTHDGVLKIDGPAGEGLIFVKNHLIADIFYAGRSDIEALAAIDSLKNARFAFYAGVPPPHSAVNLEVASVQNVIKSFRENRPSGSFR